MTLFSPSEELRIAAAIARAESTTSGEIVCVVAHAASDYRTIPLLWAAIIALVAPWPAIRLTDYSAEVIHLGQLALFAILAVLLSLKAIRFLLVPATLKRSRARQAAREQFHVQGLHRTTGRTGMLIYIAEAERYVEILADDGISKHVDAAVWREIIEVLTDSLKDGRAADGLAHAVGRCGEILEKHCPPTARNADELPNRLIIL